MGCPSDLQIQGHEVSGSLRGLSLMLITMVSLLGVGAEFLRLLWGLLVVVNDSTTIWNVRGLNNPWKREFCKNLLKKWKCDIVCFQETKVSSIDVVFVRSLWGSPFIDWAVLDTVQTSGRVLLIWDKRVFEKLDVIVG